MEGFITYDLCANHGVILATRVQGREVAAAVRPFLKRRQAVLLNFVGVELATPSFFEDLLADLRSALRLVDKAALAIAGLADGPRQNLIFALGPQRMELSELGDQDLARIGGRHHIERHVRKARREAPAAPAGFDERLAERYPSLRRHLQRLEASASNSSNLDRKRAPATDLEDPQLLVATG